MCGRYVITGPIERTKKIVKKTINIKDIQNYNAHPSQKLPVIKSYLNGKTLELLEWGIIPTWAKKKEFRALINARIETINEKVSFKRLIKLHRCIVVADGFYEWKRQNSSKYPFYIYRNDKKTIFFAGIYQNNQFCLITEKASTKLSIIHERQPVIINKKDISAYLKIENNASDLLSKCERPELSYHEIGIDVNKPSNNNPILIQEI